MQELDLAPPMFVDVQLGLHVGPLTIGVGAVSDSVACHWIPSPTWTAWLGLSGRGHAKSCWD